MSAFWAALVYLAIAWGLTGLIALAWILVRALVEATVGRRH